MMLQRDPVVFAADGFGLIRESDCVNELVVSPPSPDAEVMA